MNNTLGYNGNTRIKKAGVEHEFTRAELEEYIKCSSDPIYFASKYCKVIHPDRGLVDFELYPYQRDMYDMFKNNRFSIAMTCRQAGKSTSVSIFILWYAIFHPGKTAAILANKGATAREVLSKCRIALENLPYFLQPGANAINKGSLEFDNDSRILAASTSSDSIRGYTVNLLYLDEFAFVDNDEEFYTSTYPVITAGKSTQVIITSTPNGINNYFYKIYEGAVQGTNMFKYMKVTWKDVPGRDEIWKTETIANTSLRQFNQEHEVMFLGASNTLINVETLLSMVAHRPKSINGDENLFIYDPPKPDHEYIMTVDVSKGRGQDYSTFSVIDVTSRPFKQVCTFRDAFISPLLLPTMIVKTAQQYNNALVIVENNDVGQVVCNGIYYDLEYENLFVESFTKEGGIGVTQTKKTKAIGCSNLKDLIETGNLKVVDPKTIEELSAFIAKGNSFAASGNGHDDMVMTLVIFSWFVSTPAFELSAGDLKELLYKDREYEIDRDLLSVGFFQSSNDAEPSDYRKMKEDLDEWKSL